MQAHDPAAHRRCHPDRDRPRPRPRPTPRRTNHRPLSCPSRAGLAT